MSSTNIEELRALEAKAKADMERAREKPGIGYANAILLIMVSAIALDAIRKRKKR